MKPCRQNRKPISWLVAGCLEPAEEQQLRTHLERCEACRRHFEKLSRTTEVLVGARGPEEVPATEVFHQQLMNGLRTQPANSVPAPTFAALIRGFSGWRVLLPVAASVLVVLAVIWMVAIRPPRTQMAESKQKPALDEAASQPDLAPSLANYQAVANSSLDSLDQLITRQSQRNIPAMASYTASGLTRSCGE